jgi:hypothetical protein
LPLLFSIALGASAQEASATRQLPDAPAPKQSSPDSRRPPGNSPLKTTLDIIGRKSVFFPDLAFERGSLSSKEKLKLFLFESVAPSRFVTSAMGAGIGQARNSLGAYGQEWGGYGKRFSSSLASGTSNQLIGTYLLPSLLRQDPRYFVDLHESSGRRVKYALSRIVVTRTDRGGEAFNWSGVLAGLCAEALANSYLPDRERRAGKTFRRYGIRVGFGAANNVVKEYWPTIFKSLRFSKFDPKGGQQGPGTVPAEPSAKPPHPLP